MAKGIVKGIGTGGTNGGTLIVSDPGAGTGVPTPTPTPAPTPRTDSPKTDTGIFPGGELAFAETGFAVGDLVDFDFEADSSMAINVKKVSSGQVITGVQDGKVESTPTNAVLILNATVNGKVTGNTGTIVIAGNCVIDGKVDIDNGTTLSMVKLASGTPTINSKVDSLTKNILFIRGCIIEGKVTSNQDNYVEIMNCTIGGKLEVLSQPTAGCNISNNTVTGKVNVPAACNRP